MTENTPTFYTEGAATFNSSPFKVRRIEPNPWTWEPSTGHEPDAAAEPDDA